jgi:hypothetical protein
MVDEMLLEKANNMFFINKGGDDPFITPFLPAMAAEGYYSHLEA